MGLRPDPSRDVYSGDRERQGGVFLCGHPSGSVGSIDSPRTPSTLHSRATRPCLRSQGLRNRIWPMTDLGLDERAVAAYGFHLQLRVDQATNQWAISGGV